MDRRLSPSARHTAVEPEARHETVYSVLDRRDAAAAATARQVSMGPEHRPKTFRSILFQDPTQRVPDQRLSEPDFFVDLNLDQIVAAVTAGKEGYDLKPFFYLPLRDIDDVAFRHEVMRDLERPGLFNGIKAFAGSMRTMREHLEHAEKLRYSRQKERWFLDAVNIYCDAVTRLADDLSHTGPESRGLSAFREHVARYVASERFSTLRQQTKKLAGDLGGLHYTVLINGGRVEVRYYDAEPDYSADVEATFQKFKQGEAEQFVFNFSDSAEMNHLEEAILDLVTKLYPDIFAELESYVANYKDYADQGIVRFDREIQFYVAYLEHIERFKQAGLRFCYPRIVKESKEVYSHEGFDLALAGQLVGEPAIPVCNDFRLEGPERIIVVSGPNQGGKTTFARTFGQLHYVASLGCPVPGMKAQLFLFDRLFTHFEREEDITNLRGKLQDDLVRIHAILECATPQSIIIMNEIFTSTTFRDASVLSRKIAGKLMELDLLCVWVTFLDELASLSEKTVSMVSSVAPDSPAQRTYKIVRQPADGLAYALSIAEKYRLTYDAIKQRTRS